MAFRSLLLSLMSPARRTRAEAESRAWKAICPACGTKTSIWDLGGLRYKAAGKPLRGLKCRACGKVGMHQVAKE